MEEETKKRKRSVKGRRSKSSNRKAGGKSRRKGENVRRKGMISLRTIKGSYESQEVEMK